MAKNFYVVLGVSRDANPTQIREAHRRLVRLHHPDTGTGCIERFTEVQQAYETLSNEEERRRYDASLKGERRLATPVHDRKATRAHAFEAPVSRRRPEEMLSGLFGAVDEFFGAFVPGIFTAGRTASRRKDLYVEIILDSEEAARGGLFPLDIPVAQTCAVCDGTGYDALFICDGCRGRGIVKAKRAVEISMPKGVCDGTTATLSLEDIGLNGVDLNVLVSVHA